MTNHLTPEQVSKCLAGEITPEEERHLHDCLQCSSEVTGLQDAIAQFRGSVVNWANRECTVSPPDTGGLMRGARETLIRRLAWLSAVTAVVVLTVVPVYRKSAEQQRRMEAAQESVDAELLERINEHLSRTAPVSLQPLTELVSTTNNTQREGER
jgi:hypothetical protein